MAKYFILRAESRKLDRVIERTGGWTPRRAEWTKPKNKHKPVLSYKPVFPTWVFLPTDSPWFIHRQSVPGAQGVVKQGQGRPMVLDQSDMDRLKQIEVELCDKSPEDLDDGWEPLDIGQKVSVLGVFESMDAHVNRVMGDQVIVIVGNNIPVTVHRCLVST